MARIASQTLVAWQGQPGGGGDGVPSYGAGGARREAM